MTNTLFNLAEIILNNHSFVLKRQPHNPRPYHRMIRPEKISAKVTKEKLRRVQYGNLCYNFPPRETSKVRIWPMVNCFVQCSPSACPPYILSERKQLSLS